MSVAIAPLIQIGIYSAVLLPDNFYRIKKVNFRDTLDHDLAPFALDPLSIVGVAQIKTKTELNHHIILGLGDDEVNVHELGL